MIVITAKERNRSGFILASALLALLLIAALVAGVFYASSEATRMGAAAADRQLALGAAESAIERTLRAWNAASGSSLRIGASYQSDDAEAEMPVALYITRVDSVVYWIVADAGPPHPGSGIASRIGVFARWRRAADGSITVDRISERWWSELF
jgi:type II secretory pathway pseudopilin PulG